MATSATLIEDADRLKVALSPLRRQLLARLRAPASAAQLAGELGIARQKLNYHLRTLESAGLLELVEERQRRGFVERVLAARAAAFVVDPQVMGPRPAPAVRADVQDRFAADHLVTLASSVVRDVARMQDAAATSGERLLTFALDTQIVFATPRDLDRFTTRLARFIAREGVRCRAKTGRRYRIVAGGLPASARRASADKPGTKAVRLRAQAVSRKP